MPTTIMIENQTDWIAIYDFISDSLHSTKLNYDVENSGIGSYEFWGYIGYDKGYDYLIDLEFKGNPQFMICLKNLSEFDINRLIAEFDNESQNLSLDLPKYGENILINVLFSCTFPSAKYMLISIKDVTEG